MMNDIYQESNYSFTIEPITEEDRKIISALTKSTFKEVSIIFSCSIFGTLILIFIFSFNMADVKMVSLVSFCLLLFFLIILFAIFLPNLMGCRDVYKIVEKGVVIKQEKWINEDEVHETIYSYIGTQTYISFPGNIHVGDKISIEHSLTKKNKKNFFIKAQKI